MMVGACRKLLCRAALIAAALAGSTASHSAEAEPSGEGEPPPAKKLPPLKVSVDRARVDLERRRLEVKLSRTAEKVRIKVLDEMGAELAEEEHEFSGKPAGTPLVVTWRPRSDEPVARIEVYGYDVHGYWAGVAIVPWSLEIPHQELLFDRDSAEIKPAEVPKLEESYQRVTEALTEHAELGVIGLYIAGHTDTVASEAYNLNLSRRRARSIASWFRQRGLKIDVFYAGFGESVLAVKTEDEVDEPRNRRADYILAVEPPTLKGGRAAGWSKI